MVAKKTGGKAKAFSTTIAKVPLISLQKVPNYQYVLRRISHSSLGSCRGWGQREIKLTHVCIRAHQVFTTVVYREISA